MEDRSFRKATHSVKRWPITAFSMRSGWRGEGYDTTAMVTTNTHRWGVTVQYQHEHAYVSGHEVRVTYAYGGGRHITFAVSF